MVHELFLVLCCPALSSFASLEKTKQGDGARGDYKGQWVAGSDIECSHRHKNFSCFIFDSTGVIQHINIVNT